MGRWGIQTDPLHYVGRVLAPLHFVAPENCEPRVCAFRRRGCHPGGGEVPPGSLLLGALSCGVDSCVKAPWDPLMPARSLEQVLTFGGKGTQIVTRVL